MIKKEIMFSTNLVFSEAVSKEITRKLRYPSINGWYGTNGFKVFHMADKTHAVSAMGIYDWIKSIDVSVLDDFKSYPGSTVSITFVVPEESADMTKQKFDHTEFFGTKLERFECGQNTWK